MDNLIKTLLYINLIIFIFITIFLVINEYFTKSEVDLLVGAPRPNYDINIDTNTERGDIYGNLCGTRDEINSTYYLSDNYLSVLDPHDVNTVYYNGAIVNMSPGYRKRNEWQLPKDKDPYLPKHNPRYKILDQFNDIDQSSCRRCYGVNSNLYTELFGPPGTKMAYDDMNRCRSRAEHSCQESCTNEGDNCLGYVMLEKRMTLPPPKRNIPDGGLTQDFIRYHQSCIGNNTPNLLQPMHDIQCGLITPETLTRQNSRCVDRSYGYPIMLDYCNYNIVGDDACIIGTCEEVPESSFDNYKTIGYTCGHGSGIGGDRGFTLTGAKQNQHDNLNYIVQQNNNLNPSITSQSLAADPSIEDTFKNITFSARGLLKNYKNDSIGWKLPNLPMPIQDQWYVPCLTSTHLQQGSLDPIDIGTANYKVLNAPSSLISNSPISIDIDPSTGKPQLPQAIAQKMCEEKCLKQDFTRNPTKHQTTDAPANRNYNCGGYTVTQLNSALDAQNNSASSVNFNCKLYNKKVEAQIPYEYYPLAVGSIQGCPARSPGPGGVIPDCISPANPDIVVNMCGMKVDNPISDQAVVRICPPQAPAPAPAPVPMHGCVPAPYAPYFPPPDVGKLTGETLYNANIAHLIRAGNPKDNNYYNEYIYDKFNNSPSFKDCIKNKKRSGGKSDVSICDKDIPFGKIRTSSPPPKFLIHNEIVGVPTNMWFPWTVP